MDTPIHINRRHQLRNVFDLMRQTNYKPKDKPGGLFHLYSLQVHSAKSWKVIPEISGLHRLCHPHILSLNNITTRAKSSNSEQRVVIGQQWNNASTCPPFVDSILNLLHRPGRLQLICFNLALIDWAFCCDLSLIVPPFLICLLPQYYLTSTFNLMINFGVKKSRLIDRYSGQHFFKHRQSKKKRYRFYI